MSYAEKLKGGNKSDTEEKGGEEEEKEEDKKAGDEEEKEDPNDDSSNGHNSNMAGLQALPPFDLDLTHVLTIVCAFPNNSKPVQAVREFGITDFDNFRSIEYDHEWEYDDNGPQVVTGNYGIILSTIIAYARDMEPRQHNDKDSPQNWTHEDFNLWRRTEYSAWKKSGAAAAASGTPASNSSTGATTTAADD